MKQKSVKVRLEEIERELREAEEFNRDLLTQVTANSIIIQYLMGRSAERLAATVEDINEIIARYPSMFPELPGLQSYLEEHRDQLASTLHEKYR